MLELKFRIWNKKTKRFVTGYKHRCGYEEFYSDPPGIFFAGLMRVQADEDYVLQQFTGLTDSKGKDIYEGDIIKETHFEDWKDETGYDYFGVVKHVVYVDKANGHQVSRYSSFPKLEGMTGYAGNPISVKCEVIGNIFGLPCKPDHNGECLVCDCWLSECPLEKLIKAI